MFEVRDSFVIAYENHSLFPEGKRLRLPTRPELLKIVLLCVVVGSDSIGGRASCFLDLVTLGVDMIGSTPYTVHISRVMVIGQARQGAPVHSRKSRITTTYCRERARNRMFGIIDSNFLPVMVVLTCLSSAVTRLLLVQPGWVVDVWISKYDDSCPGV